MRRFISASFAALLFSSQVIADSFSPPTSAPVVSLSNSYAVRCGSLVGANFNSTADQPITITSPTTTWYLWRVLITNPSISLTTAAGGIYTAAGKTGSQMVASSQAYSGLLTPTVNGAGSALLIASNIANILQNQTTIYFSLTTAQGAAATADIDIWCTPVR